MDKDKRQVIINRAVFFYRDKEPFVSSGKSVAGAIEYDADNDLLKCHECGEFKKMLGRHVSIVHKIPSRVYKLKHGLNQSSALVSETVRSKLSKHAQTRADAHKLPPMWNDPVKLAQIRIKAITKRKQVTHIAAAERRNAVLHCKAQLMEKLKNIAISLKRTPSRKELKENGIPVGSLEYHFGSLAKAMKLAGLLPNGNIGSRNYRRYTDDYLLRSIRIFAANNGRLPQASDYRRDLLGASRSTYRYHFTTLKRANQLAISRKQKQCLE